MIVSDYVNSRREDSSFRTNFAKFLIRNMPWLTPNRLTWLRVFLSPLIILSLIPNLTATNFLAFMLLFLAGITDYMDGPIARLTNNVSDNGKLLDRVADKILIVPLMLMLAYYNATYWALVLGVILGEALLLIQGPVYTLLKIRYEVSSNFFGKKKMVVQWIAGLELILTLIATSIHVYLGYMLFYPGQLILAVSIFFTIGSLIGHHPKS